jgi:hypothetical protein
MGFVSTPPRGAVDDAVASTGFEPIMRWFSGIGCRRCRADALPSEQCAFLVGSPRLEPEFCLSKISARCNRPRAQEVSQMTTSEPPSTWLSDPSSG